MTPANRRSIRPTLGYPYLAAIAIIVSAMLSHGKATWSAALINEVLMLVAIAISTAAHEIAHASVARAVGLRPTALYLGRGPIVWQRTIGETQVVVQAVPITGATMIAAPSLHWIRIRLMAVFAAGPVANAILFFASRPFLSDEDRHHGLAIVPAPLLAFVLVNGALAFLNALPFRGRIRSGTTHPATDGWNFLSLPFRSEEKLTPIVAAYQLHESRRLIGLGKVAEARALLEGALQRDPTSTILRAGWSDLLMLTEEWSAGALALRELLADPKIEKTFGAVSALLSNNLAWADFMLDDAALLDEADHHSLIAITKLPDRHAPQGTRGAILLVRGDLVEAEKLLLSSHAGNTAATSRAFNACCLAMICGKKKAIDEARSWLEKARTLNPKCSLLPRAEKAIAEASVSATS